MFLLPQQNEAFFRVIGADMESLKAKLTMKKCNKHKHQYVPRRTQHLIPEKRGRGSNAVWNFSKKSSVLKLGGFPSMSLNDSELHEFSISPGDAGWVNFLSVQEAVDPTNRHGPLVIIRRVVIMKMTVTWMMQTTP